MNLDVLEDVAVFFFALAVAGFVAWVLWITWLYVARPRRYPEPPVWVNEGHQPRAYPKCQRSRRGAWRDECTNG